MSSLRIEISPEKCPEPFWHTTHRYCPCCSWVEPKIATRLNCNEAELRGQIAKQIKAHAQKVLEAGENIMYFDGFIDAAEIVTKGGSDD